MERKIVGILFILIIGFVAKAQEETFTDEELTKYATVMKWAEDEKSKMGKEVGVWVNESEVLSGTKYKELRAANKKGKLAEAEATEEELAAFNKIIEDTETSKDNFKVTYTDKIKDEISVGLYNNLKKALKSDKTLKSRYEKIYASINAGTEASNKSESEGEDSGNLKE